MLETSVGNGTINSTYLKASTITSDSYYTFSGNVGNPTISVNELINRLNEIENRLAILKPNDKLEEKWENLKKLGDAYRALEKEILEKETTWNILSK